jgi:hypothetical protein
MSVVVMLEVLSNPMYIYVELCLKAFAYSQKRLKKAYFGLFWLILASFDD